MVSNGVKLLGLWRSPFVLRVGISLHLKSVEYEFIEENNPVISKSQLLLQSNPVHKKVPVLFHGNKTLCESLIIVEYIDEVWASSGPSILPSDPHDRATARFWAAYLDAKWWPNLRAILMADGDEAKTTEPLKEVTQGLIWLEEVFVKYSKGQNFFGGEKIGYLDLAFGGFLAWLRVIQKRSNLSLIDEAKTPNLFKWAQHFSSDPAVKDVLPETDKLLKFAEFLAEFLRNKFGGSKTSS